jgi:hypothetical protein
MANYKLTGTLYIGLQPDFYSFSKKIPYLIKNNFDKCTNCTDYFHKNVRSETLVPTTRTLTSVIFKELQQEATMIIPQQQQQLDVVCT